MTLDEATTDLSIQREVQTRLRKPHQAAAIALAMAALKFRQRWEDQEGEEVFPLLPGQSLPSTIPPRPGP